MRHCELILREVQQEEEGRPEFREYIEIIVDPELTDGFLTKNDLIVLKEC